MQRKNFIKVKEDFTCEHCGYHVIGTGYTDHCPQCLFGKHVDLVIPGDRLAICRGLLEPIGLQTVNGKQQIIFRCQTCKQIKYCKVAPNDNQDILVSLQPGRMR